MKSLVVFTGLLVTALVNAGCSVETDMEGVEEDVSMAEEPIGGEGCATGTPDATTGDPPYAESPLAYSNASCYKAYVVRVNNWAHIYNRHLYVQWNSAIPTDQTACTNAWMRADLYRLVGSTWQFVRTGSLYGKWYGTRCQINTLEINPGTSGTYKIAMTARKSNSSAALTRRVKLSSGVIIE